MDSPRSRPPTLNEYSCRTYRNIPLHTGQVRFRTNVSHSPRMRGGRSLFQQCPGPSDNSACRYGLHVPVMSIKVRSTSVMSNRARLDLATRDPRRARRSGDQYRLEQQPDGTLTVGAQAEYITLVDVLGDCPGTRRRRARRSTDPPESCRGAATPTPAPSPRRKPSRPSPRPSAPT